MCVLKQIRPTGFSGLLATYELGESYGEAGKSFSGIGFGVTDGQPSEHFGKRHHRVGEENGVQSFEFGSSAMPARASSSARAKTAPRESFNRA
ncbi:hypothetical protein [Rhodococcus erythropolis]|uniref:hypothetical protein n=1 Tax=Rhodococcus erythropolis TaxID=1833 RepID=UPI003982A39A